MEREDFIPDSVAYSETYATIEHLPTGELHRSSVRFAKRLCAIGLLAADN
jgi:hypothetical protein